MMSQNRQEKKDRIRAEHDYEINMKAEILIEELINKLTSLEKKQDEIIINLNGTIYNISERPDNRKSDLKIENKDN